MDYLCACTAGMFIINRWTKKGELSAEKKKGVDETLSPNSFQDKNEIPVADSIDKFSVQVVMVLFVYLVTLGLAFIYWCALTWFLCRKKGN